MRLTRLLAEDFGAFCDRFGITLYDHQREDFGEALCREGGSFVHRLAAISWPRGDGKSWGAAATGLWRLVAGRPPQHVLCSALDTEGAKVILGHAKAIRRGHPDFETAIEVRANELLVPATESRLTITSRDHTASRGQHPDLILYDEAGWARDDELFAALLAGQASAPDPMMLVTSTVGRRRSGPLWTIKQQAEGGDAGVCWRWSGENRSPKVTEAFLARQRRLLLPGQFAREHQNRWVDAADSFTTAKDVDAAMGCGWTEQHQGRSGVLYDWFVDIGTIHDPTVIGIGHDDGGSAYVDKLVTFQGDRENPVKLSEVERAIRNLAETFTPKGIRVESWQGMASVERLQSLGLPVELFTPTAKTNAEEWPLLAQRLSARSVVLYPHARLREELLNLTYEVGPSGIRVIDRGKIHQDHAVAVRGVVAQVAKEPQATGLVWGTPGWRVRPGVGRRVAPRGRGTSPLLNALRDRARGGRPMDPPPDRIADSARAGALMDDPFSRKSRFK